MKTIKALLSLYRIDSFILTVGSYFVTLILLNAGTVNMQGIVLGLLLGTVFVNFIYAINSYFDADIDAINKPHRPIPSGIISKGQAAAYIGLLGVLSVLLPLLFISNKQVAAALCIFPILGVFYSNPIFPLKKIALIASLITATILVLPATIAVMYSHKLQGNLAYIAIVFLYCLCMVPLKDIEDEKGDVAHNSGNWAHMLGAHNLVMFSSTALIGLSIAAFCMQHIQTFILLSAVFACSAGVQLVFLVKKLPLHKVYGALILTNITLLILGILAYLVKTALA